MFARRAVRRSSDREHAETDCPGYPPRARTASCMTGISDRPASRRSHEGTDSRSQARSWCRDRALAPAGRSDYDVLPESRTQRHFLIQIGAAAADYRTGEKAVGTSSLFSCRTGRTPLCGGHAPPGLRDSSRMRARSPRSLYTQVWTNLLSPPSSLVQQAASPGRRCRCASHTRSRCRNPGCPGRA